MRSALVTGAAGFIGSHLTERLLADGYSVVGIDRLSDYYRTDLKIANIAGFVDHEAFRFVPSDLNDIDLDRELAGVETVFHVAAQPGVRGSWADGFRQYAFDNIVSTQRLLESATQAGVERLIYSSSSSVYGDAVELPTSESTLPRPISPYGVSKLAAEHLVHAYGRNSMLQTVSLRYFTVYGPRQRPDMATHRLIESCINGTEFPMYGDGSQVRDFTYVDDVVDANVRAAEIPDLADQVINIAGGSSVSLRDLVSVIEQQCQRSANITMHDPKAGDVRETSADRSKSERLLSWIPSESLEIGAAAQVDWHMGHR